MWTLPLHQQKFRFRGWEAKEEAQPRWALNEGSLVEGSLVDGSCSSRSRSSKGADLPSSSPLACAPGASARGRLVWAWVGPEPHFAPPSSFLLIAWGCFSLGTCQPDALFRSSWAVAESLERGGEEPAGGKRRSPQCVWWPAAPTSKDSHGY